MQKRFKGLGVWIATFIVIYLIYFFMFNMFSGEVKMVYSDLVNSIKSEEIASITVSGNTVNATLKNGKTTHNNVNFTVLII